MKFSNSLPLLFLGLILKAHSQLLVPLESIPTHLHHRVTPANRLAAIQKLEGLPASCEAIANSLRYLKNTQNKDGSWTPEVKVSTTAMALLCFLGNGETAQSDEFGITILNGLDYLITKAVSQRGMLSDDIRDRRWPYEHALAVYALAEAYALCEKGYGEKIPNLKRAVEVGGQFIMNNQHKGGGWDYGYDQDSGRGGDVSITGWQLQALKACQLTEIDFANMTRCYKNGLDYIERMQAPSGAIGYSSPNGLHGDGTTLAAVGALCFQTWKNSSDKVARKSVKFMDKEMKFAWDTPSCDLYGHFFAAQAMKNHGGDPWKRYHAKVFPEILKNQATNGSFLAPNHGNPATVEAVNPLYAVEDEFGKHYRNCLATLILQTYYR